MQRRWRRSLGGLALLLALGQAPALAATISVGGACTLVDAITAANNDAPAGGCTAGSGADTLVLAAGSTNTLIAVNNSTYGPTGLPFVTSGITIAGNGSTITRVPSAPEFRILAVAANGNLTLQETTVSGGVSPNFGGGIAINAGGALTLTNSTISGNSAGGAGGNANGGGMFNSGTLTLTNSTVSGNSAGGNARGGGVYNSGTLTLTNSTVSGNSGVGRTRGGGVFNSGTLTLTNSTVSGNSGGDRTRGGGIDNSGQATLALSLVSGNTAEIGAEISSAYLGNVTANNFNLFGHSGLTGAQAFSDFIPGPSDLTATSEGTRPTALGAILGPTLADNGGPTRTHALIAGSPAVDAVAAGNCFTTIDQRGAPRPQDGDGNTGCRLRHRGFRGDAAGRGCGPRSESPGPLHRVALRHPHPVQSRPGL